MIGRELFPKAHRLFTLAAANGLAAAMEVKSLTTDCKNIVVYLPGSTAYFFFPLAALSFLGFLTFFC